MAASIALSNQRLCAVLFSSAAWLTAAFVFKLLPCSPPLLEHFNTHIAMQAVKHGVGLAEVCAHLDRRALKISRRPGNAKAERIAAAEAHFKAVAEAKAVAAEAKAAPAEGGAVGGAGAGAQ